MHRIRFSARLSLLVAVAAIAAALVPARLGAQVSFHDLTAAPGSGIDWVRSPSTSFAVVEAIRSLGPVSMEDFAGPYPIKPHGAPGVALLDFDRDGDLDIYVTNGPGTPNSLYSSQLRETGELSFVDVAVAAGVDASAYDSTGVCFGDLDNDGDDDLYVLSRGEPNRLFENLGDGSFTDITEVSDAGGGNDASMTCSLGDVDGDGLLDIVVANTFEMSSSNAIFLVPFALNEHNRLLLNIGSNRFLDVGEASGVADPQDITWSAAMVDLDQDGDTDVVTASDNGAIPFARFGGIDRGFVRWLRNGGDGSVVLTDVTTAAGLHLSPGDFMGLSFADFNHDGTLDVFATNTGDYLEPFFGLGTPLGAQTSRWFLQHADGTFEDPGVGDLVATPFGWGTAALDYDNDGDTDVVFYGGLDVGAFVEGSNPGVMLANDGHARFHYDAQALATSTDHRLRIDHGLAVGDIDGNGFPDIVSASSINLPTGPPLSPVPYPIAWGSPFDGLAVLFPSFLPGPAPGTFVWSGVELPRGTLAVELNQGGNGNGGIAVRARGSVAVTPGGAVNRSGIGAVVRVTPEGGATAVLPVLGGSSYASQHALEQTFGLGRARRATVEILWPGGVRNRLYGVRPGERILFPEIACSFDDPGLPQREYVACVQGELDALVGTGVLSRAEAARFRAGALRARAEQVR